MAPIAKLLWPCYLFITVSTMVLNRNKMKLIYNKSQSNLAIGDRRHLCELGVRFLKSPLPTTHLSNTMLYLDHTSVPVKWLLIPSNGFSRVRECDRHPYRRTYIRYICRNRTRLFAKGTAAQAKNGNNNDGNKR